MEDFARNLYDTVQIRNPTADMEFSDKTIIVFQFMLKFKQT